MEYDAIGNYVIVTTESKTEKNTSGFEIVTNQENKRTSVGNVVGVGTDAKIKCKVGDKVMYFNEEAIPVNQHPNVFVLRIESVFAKFTEVE